MEPEAIRRERQAPVAVEDVVGGRRAQDRLDRTGAEPLDPVGDAPDAAPALELAGGPDDGAGQADVGLDHTGDLMWRCAAVDQLECLVASLAERRLALGLVEGCRENSPAPLAPSAVLGATPCRGRRCHGGLIGSP